MCEDEDNIPHADSFEKIEYADCLKKIAKALVQLQYGMPEKKEKDVIDEDNRSEQEP